MSDITRRQLSRNLRAAAVVLVLLRTVGSMMWMGGFDDVDNGDRLNYVLAEAPLGVGFAALLYVAAVLLGRPDPARPKAPVAADPAVTASVLDLDAPISHTVFQPPTTGRAPTSPIPIGDPHAAFRRE